MEMAEKEVNSVGNNNRYIKSTCFSFDCRWYSRGWQAKEGFVAAIAQKTGKIIDTVRKRTYFRDCPEKQKPRGYNEMTALEYMEWFINYNSYFNHTGTL